MPKTTLSRCVVMLLAVLPLLSGAGAVAQREGSRPPAPAIRLGTQYLWSPTGVECIAGCNGTPEPIVLGTGTEWPVAVENFEFNPPVIDIAAGDSVTWTNDSEGVHNVQADDGSFRCANGCDGQGGDGTPASNAWVVTLTFPDVAVVPYFCELHGTAGGVGMSGVINVLDLLIFEDGFEAGDTGEWDAVIQ